MVSWTLNPAQFPLVLRAFPNQSTERTSRAFEIVPLVGRAGPTGGAEECKCQTRGGAASDLSRHIRVPSWAPSHEAREISTSTLLPSQGRPSRACFDIISTHTTVLQRLWMTGGRPIIFFRTGCFVFPLFPPETHMASYGGTIVIAQTHHDTMTLPELIREQLEMLCLTFSNSALSLR